MSGIYIKGMKMPRHCWSCCFHDEVDDCIILKESCMAVWGEQKRLSDCPLICVPDHGRLIDADALLQEFYKAQKSYDAHGRPFSDAFMSGNEICAEWWSVERKVEDAPTIIPAEEEQT